jgi:hypothetical protein
MDPLHVGELLLPHRDGVVMTRRVDRRWPQPAPLLIGLLLAVLLLRPLLLLLLLMLLLHG